MVASINEVALSAMSLGGDPMAAARFIAIGSVTNVALSIAGGFAFGPWAVAASTLAGNLVLAFLVWRWTRAAFRWDASTLGRTFLPVLIAIPTGAVFAFVCDVSGLHGLVSTVIGCLGALVVGGALLWRLRPVPEEAAA
jgi:peptidoglycan biosynthesis protein MviN/MurJ (putative lipid II flippase)